MGKKRVFIGVIGTDKDGGTDEARWERWRPTVDLFRSSGPGPFARAELLYLVGAKTSRTRITDKDMRTLAGRIARDIRTVSPETEVGTIDLSIRDPWDFESAYVTLYEHIQKRIAGRPWDPDNEEYFVHIGTGTHVIRICLFLLVETKHLPGKLLQSLRPADNRPPGDYAVIDLDLKRYDFLAKRFKKRMATNIDNLKSGISTRNAAFNDMMKRLERVATNSRAPILLTGPTGAGKSRLAGRIYDVKKAGGVSGAFVEVNCATIRGDTAVSSLFGHRKGAFTGAAADRDGLLLEADGGVLFLDEIGELGLDEQAMLLGALETGRFMPMGSDKETSSSFQFIAGTNRNLVDEAAAGRFRKDLLARLNLWPFRLPGLAERREDIEPNLDYELERVGADMNLNVAMNDAARRRFLAFAESPDSAWSDNFRDLGGAVRRMATLADGGRIGEADVEAEIVRLKDKWCNERLASERNRRRQHAGPNEEAAFLRSVAPARDMAAGEGRTGGDTQPDDPVAAALGREKVAGLNRLGRAEVAEALLVCRESPSMAEAGRRLFGRGEDRESTGKRNYSDRMKKFLARYGLTWDDVH